MANQPKTPGRSVRVDEDLWTQAGIATAAQGTDRTTVMVEALRSYVQDYCAMTAPATGVGDLIGDHERSA